MEELGSFGRAEGWKSAEGVGTHSLRRAAVRGILDAGGSPAQPLTLGRWRSSASRHFLGQGREGSQAMAPLLVEALDDED